MIQKQSLIIKGEFMSKRMIDSELIEALGTDIRFDGTGNVMVGKNLEVGGKTQLNGGIKPIHTYKLDGITTLYVIFKDVDHDSSVPNDFMGYGWIERFGNGRPCIFYYALKDGKVSVFKGLSSDTIYEYSNNKMQTFEIAKESKCQAKLYRHKITLNGIYVLMYNSTSNLSVGSVTDLRTIMKIKSESNEEILPVCASDATSMVTLVVTTSLCQVDGSDVTTVSDTVTTL